MSKPDKAVVEKVHQWISYADEDLALARHGLTTPGNPPARLVAYHAQQCAEKYLKAYLVLKGVDFPYTHNISRLLELCEGCGAFPSTLEEAERLTPYAVTARYPGADEQVSVAEAERAVAIASEVRRTMRALLAGAGADVADGEG